MPSFHVYSQARSWLSEAEREQLCEVMDCQKLSLEACTHAAKNKRLPMRVVVQVLFFKQLQLRASVAGCQPVSGNLEESGPLSSGGVAISGETEVGMDSMTMRLAELEKEYSDMSQEIKKLRRGGKSGGGGGWTSHLSRRFGLKDEAADVRHPGRGSVSELQKNMSAKLDKLKAKLSKQKRQLFCADASS
jgi:hypothetical protein